MNDLITLREAVKTHHRGTEAIHAVDHVSLTVAQGEFVAVVGPSGSGKTTLLELIGAIDKPSAGEITIDGQSVTAMNDAALTRLRSRTIGFVFQQFFLLPTLTAAENVALPAMFAGKSNADRRARELLSLVGLDGREDHLPSQLSGGQMQRVAIARALINDPKILLADEPTGSLDSVAAQGIFDTLRSLHQSGTTVLVVTHNPDLAAACGRVIRMRDGKIH
ncbi:ABC transporter ATP-binding protein [Massilia putida]|uniref:ABC transporter ATP-binding protein n=1 Tax=Massilia putida TaxID=1141883 RepID=UPI000951E1EC|nr:ABC transporter ATP-binding protein [Massilia putida]